MKIICYCRCEIWGGDKMVRRPPELSKISLFQTKVDDQSENIKLYFRVKTCTILNNL